MNFDDNQWYHVYVGGDKDNSFVGTALVFGDPLLEDTTKHNTTTGAVFKSTNQIENDEGTQKWQIVPVDSDYYVFRTWAGGVHGYLSTNFAENRSNLTSRTLGRMVRDNVSDASVYWKITSWKDGTFQLTNKRNGTDWLMEIGGEHDEDDGTEAHMSSNFTKIPRRQFSFEAIGEVNGTDIGKINNGDWARASISLPATATQSSTSSTTPTSSNTSNPPSSTSSSAGAASGGLSTGAKAGIGAGVGIAALIALAMLGFFLFRRRSRHTALNTDEPNSPNPYTNGYSDEVGESGTTKYGHVGVAEKAELDSRTTRAELPSEQSQPAELPGGEVPRQELSGRNSTGQQPNEGARA